MEIRAENTRRISGAKPLALGIRPGRVQAMGPGVNQSPRPFVLGRHFRPCDAGRASLHKAAWRRNSLNCQRNECLFWGKNKNNCPHFICSGETFKTSRCCRIHLNDKMSFWSFNTSCSSCGPSSSLLNVCSALCDVTEVNNASLMYLSSQSETLNNVIPLLASGGAGLGFDLGE